MDPVVDCLGVRKRYRNATALEGVSLQVQPGSLYGFLGPNGAGKSTLVKILTGLVSPTGGAVAVMGGQPRTREVQRRIGYLPELFRFPPWLTGVELLEFHGRLIGTPVDADALCNLVGIGPAKDRRIGEYSKGMQQRLGLAQALVGEPELVFLDEPTSALDPLGRLEVRDVLLHLQERGTAVFLNSHLLTEVEKVCDQVAVIDKGRIVAEGRTEDLLQRSEARIRVGTQDPASIDAFWSSCSQSQTVLDDSTYADGVLTLPLSDPDDVPKLVRAAVQAGLPVYEVGLVRRSLEDIFVELVGNSGGAAVAAEDRSVEPARAEGSPS